MSDTAPAGNNGQRVEVSLALEYKFTINAYTPETLPMARLAEYMADLAKLLGYDKSIHFSHLESGSSVVAYRVDLDAAIEVTERVVNARAGSGPQEAIQAIQSINRKLVQDRTDGYIQERQGAEIIRFPGYQPDEIEAAVIKTPMQPDSLDGVVQRVGKLGNQAAVLLEASDGRVFACKTLRSTARKLAIHIFGAEVRLRGFAKWHRTSSGYWLLDEFFIQDFDVLSDEKLSDVIAELHSVEGSGWAAIKDPWHELAELRDGGGKGEL